MGNKGDGLCHDENNIEACEYDGGDCCGSNVKTSACSECQCLDPNATEDASSEGCKSSDEKGDGYCDDGNNNAECEWDGGDCCGSNVNTGYCSKCQCLDPDHGSCESFNEKGDGYCDDKNNVESCEWDGGDCCGSNVNTIVCDECQCLDPNHGSASGGTEDQLTSKANVAKN